MSTSGTKLVLWLVLAVACFGQNNNGNQVNVGGIEAGSASYFRPQVGSGTPPTADCNTTGAITSSTNASPIVITTAATVPPNGTVVTVYKHTTNTGADGTWQVGSATGTTFALCGYWDGTTCQNPSTGTGVGATTGYFSTQVGRIYARNDAASASASIYFCADTTGGSPGWTLQSTTSIPVTGITGLGTNVATFLATPTGANFNSMIAAGGVPISQNSQSTAYTTVLSDGGGEILHPTADNNARTYTIAANASVAYPVGTVIKFTNQINTVTLAINSDTLQLAGTATTGSRTIAAGGFCVAQKEAATLWYASGPGCS